MKLAEGCEEAVPENLSMFDLPPAHRIQLCSTHGLKRINRALRQRARAGKTTQTDSSIRLVGTLLTELDANETRE